MCFRFRFPSSHVLSVLLTTSLISTIGFAKTQPMRGWQWWASRLTLGVESQAEALAHLKSEPALDSKLRKALSTSDRYVAYDVIATLKIHGLLEDLLHASEADQEGYSYLAMNTLIQPNEMVEYAKIYRERVGKISTPGSVRLVLIDTLARMGVQISSAQLRDFLLTDPLPEFRRATLTYIRSLHDTRPVQDEISLLGMVLIGKDVNTKMRLQALYFAGELNSSQFKNLGKMTSICRADYPAKVQSICLRLSRNGAS